MSINNIKFPLDSLVLTPNSTTPQRIVAIDLEAKPFGIKYCVEDENSINGSFLRQYKDEIKSGRFILSNFFNPDIGRHWYKESELAPSPTLYSLLSILTYPCTTTTTFKSSNRDFSITKYPSGEVSFSDYINAITDPSIEQYTLFNPKTYITQEEAFSILLQGKPITTDLAPDEHLTITIDQTKFHGINPSTLTFYTLSSPPPNRIKSPF